MGKSKLAKAGVITAGTIGALFVAGSVYMGKLVSDNVIYPNKNEDTIENSVKQLEKWGYDLKGFENTYKGVEISSVAEDGNVVPGTYFENGSDKCVVLVHCLGGDRVSSYPLAQLYLEEGYDVITYDQRGSGVNPDNKVTFGIFESRDVKAMVRYAREELGKKEVIVHGQSMGGQTTAIYASNVEPQTVEAADAVICDSPVPGMEYMIRDSIGDGPEGAYSSMTNYLVTTGKIYMKLTSGVSLADGDTIKEVRNDKLPTLVIVSEKDEVCLPDKVEEVYDNVACEDKQIVYVNSAHIEGMIDDPEGYMDNVDKFLESVGL